MQDVRGGVQRLDAGNRYVHGAVRAVATGAQVLGPPDEPVWRERAGQHGVLSIIAEYLQPSADG